MDDEDFGTWHASSHRFEVCELRVNESWAKWDKKRMHFMKKRVRQAQSLVKMTESYYTKAKLEYAASVDEYVAQNLKCKTERRRLKHATSLYR